MSIRGPLRMARKRAFRRYGFHGISPSILLPNGQPNFLECDLKDLRLITLPFGQRFAPSLPFGMAHSVDTTMGFYAPRRIDDG